MSAILIFMLALLVVVAAAGCSSSDGTGAEVVTGDAADETAEEPEAPAEADAPGTRTNPLPVGTTAKVGDWEVTVTAVNKNANDAVAAANQFNEPPVEGSQYVLATVSAKYVGEESGTFWVDMSYKFYGSGGNTFDSGGQSMAVPPNALSDAGETFPDASVSGDMVFEVPSDQIEGGAIIMESSFSMEDTRVFFALQ
ncbi:MAG: hypothetical protein WBJ62_07960 [Coriobacteriia bacterium]